MPIPKHLTCDCLRCGHAWMKRLDPATGRPKADKPKRCPKCKSPYWDKPVGKLPMGRPKKAAKKGKGK